MRSPPARLALIVRTDRHEADIRMNILMGSKGPAIPQISEDR